MANFESNSFSLSIQEIQSYVIRTWICQRYIYLPPVPKEIGGVTVPEIIKLQIIIHSYHMKTAYMHKQN